MPQPKNTSRRVMKPRTKPRVEDTEPKGSVKKSAVHRGRPQIKSLENGVEVTGQGSELVPVAQYASVTIGPVAVRAVIPIDGIELLAEVDWTDDVDADYDKLTKEQREVFDRCVNGTIGVQRVVDTVIARDRAIVEESVRLHNEREEEEAKSSKRR